MDDRHAVAIPPRPSQRTIDDVADAGKIAISRRFLPENVEPFFPPIDIIIRG
jgi:hypothetical protein